MAQALPEACDLLVVGSGAAGLGATFTAAQLGLDVVVGEQHRQFGGTTAWSGGWLWVPGNPLALAAGIVEHEDAPRRRLRHLPCGQFDPARIDTFLAHAPAMGRVHLQHGALRFIDGNDMASVMGGHYPSGGITLGPAPTFGYLLAFHAAGLPAPTQEPPP